MKKKLKIFILSSILLTGILLNNSNPSVMENNNHTGLIEQALDYNNQTGASVKNIHVGQSNSVDVSKTYAQLGQDQGVYYLRYITAVTGPIKSITYTRTSERLNVNVYEVSTIYKGVQANEEIVYYDGNSFVTEATEATDNYYFACYTIKFTTDVYLYEDISAYVTVTSESGEIFTSEQKTVSLYEMIENIMGPAISLDIEEVNLSIGEEAYIGDRVNVSKDTTLSWVSDNTSVATVSDGFIQANNVGVANITVTAPNGSMASCVVNVTSGTVKPFKLNLVSKSIYVGTTLSLSSNDDRTLSFASSDNSILSVTNDGKVTANKTG